MREGDELQDRQRECRSWCHPGTLGVSATAGEHWRIGERWRLKGSEPFRRWLALSTPRRLYQNLSTQLPPNGSTYRRYDLLVAWL